MRLIDGDALEELFRETIGHIAKMPEIDGALEHLVRASAMAIEMIQDATTIEAVPMRRTKPVMGVSRDQLRNWWQCGNCESVIEQGDRYCRGCGAEVEWDGGK